MTKKEIIERVKKYAKEKMEGEATGHDWWHAFRVWKLSKKISKKEGGDLFTIELSALLHDLADWKFNKSESQGLRAIKKLLENLKVEKVIILKVCNIIKSMSFKGAGAESRIKTLEGKIVQDADRLDSFGAIGIARTFAYGGKVGRPIYDPNIKPRFHKSFREYKKHGNSSSINHFYEKLLLLKDLMSTKTAKKIAEKRHKFIEQFLSRFFKEWEGKDRQNLNIFLYLK